MALRIIFMGTPDFAVASLEALVKNNCNVVAVITAPDKPAGRGLQIHESPVKIYAALQNIPVLQPDKLKDPIFIDQLKNFKADLQVVVAFRMLPEVIWNMPTKGTFNLHASLLPNYRGAAPINWAVINGEKETGVTTFFIEQEIDTGNILFQEKTLIGETESAGSVHDRLMCIGAELVVKTVNSIENNLYNKISQKELLLKNPEIKSAPKIFKEDCRIMWNHNVLQIHNFIRGLSPYPAAWTELKTFDERILNVKIFEADYEIQPHNFKLGTIFSDDKTFLKVAASNGFVKIESLQVEGKKRLQTEELLRGFKNISQASFL